MDLNQFIRIESIFDEPANLRHQQILVIRTSFKFEKIEIKVGIFSRNTRARFIKLKAAFSFNECKSLPDYVR